jgi:hypothetical protein
MVSLGKFGEDLIFWKSNLLNGISLPWIFVILICCLNCYCCHIKICGQSQELNSCLCTLKQFSSWVIEGITILETKLQVKSCHALNDWRLLFAFKRWDFPRVYKWWSKLSRPKFPQGLLSLFTLPSLLRVVRTLTAHGAVLDSFQDTRITPHQISLSASETWALWTLI